VHLPIVGPSSTFLIVGSWALPIVATSLRGL
jgi:hypothetical protein